MCKYQRIVGGRMEKVGGGGGRTGFFWNSKKHRWTCLLKNRSSITAQRLPTKENKLFRVLFLLAANKFKFVVSISVCSKLTKVAILCRVGHNFHCFLISSLSFDPLINRTALIFHFENVNLTEECLFSNLFKASALKFYFVEFVKT
jgi:hypothetical protein